MGMAEHREALKKAEESVSKVVREVSRDPHRPLYHASPNAYWMNDPNGLIHYKGEYHLFYQHNPYAPVWGQIHWSHMKSTDLIHWEDLPIALAPSEPYDADGCFSGSAVEHEGKLYLFYTGHRFAKPQALPDDLQQQCMAVSTDGIHFDKWEQNPIIAAPPDAIGQNNHFRDPKVWRHNGRWYMVLGTKKDERGKVVLYRSDDLLHWEFFSVLTESDGSMGYMHECPDLFALGGKEVLVFSPQGVAPQGEPDLSGYYIGRLDYGNGSYEHGSFHRLDYGFNFYAPQTFEDAQGRRILFGWMPMQTDLGKLWTGCMTIPRELTYAGGGKLNIRPVEEMKRLRQRHVRHDDVRVTPDQFHTVQGICGDCVEMRVTFDLQKTDAAQFGLHVRVSDDGREKTIIRYDADSREIVFDRTHSGAGDQGIRKYAVQNGGTGTLTLHLFLDRCTVELFINEGEAVMSGLIFPEPSSTGIGFFSNGGTVAIRHIDFWVLAP